MTANKKAASAGAANGTADAGFAAETCKNNRDVYRVKRRGFNSYRLADVRVWHETAMTGALRPGMDVIIKVEALPETVEAPARMMNRGRG